MVYIISRAEVDDYDKAKKIFDELDELRKSLGQKSIQIFRGVKNPNEVVIVREWESLEKWEQLSSSDEAREKIKESGVVWEPVNYIVEKD